MITSHGLIRIIKVTCLDRGEFTLAGGAKSSYYLDLRKLTLSPAVHALAEQIMSSLGSLQYEAVGGPTIGADPIVGAYLYRSLIISYKLRDRWLRGFLVRPATKGHGKAGRVVGLVRPGDRCVLVDDVATSGGSLIDAADALKEFGCSVIHAVVIVDRLAGARERLAERGIPLTALCTIEDLGIAQP